MVMVVLTIIFYAKNTGQKVWITKVIGLKEVFGVKNIFWCKNTFFMAQKYSFLWRKNKFQPAYFGTYIIQRKKINLKIMYQNWIIFWNLY